MDHVFVLIFGLIAGLIYVAEANQCGIKPPGNRIVGGEEADRNEYPWQIMMRIKKGDLDLQFCGGSLISPDTVLTAAHCVNLPNGLADYIYVRVGAHYRQNISIGTEQDVDVAEIIAHEEYNSDNYRNDIAVLKLAKPVMIGKGVDIVCLPDESNPLPFDNLSKKCYITGWGTLASGGSQPNELYEASVPLVSNKRCRKAYSKKEIHKSMLCAGLDEGGVDSCQGDSGGPLVCEFNGKWYLEGVTSWGYGCAFPNKFGVYASVRYLLSWVNSSMGPRPPTPPPPTSAPLPCGRSPMSRVIGGVDALPGNWPWQIALLKGRSKYFSCGGSLIAPDWVLTAAHCISQKKPARYYTIRLGDHNRNVQEGPEQDIRAKKVIVHPQYGKPVLNNDIALIQLSRPATLNARVGTVCLPSQDAMVSTSATCYITGWGKIRHPGSAHHILQQANMPPVTNSECSRKLATSPAGSHLTITENMLCAGVNGTNLSGCHGDSGGPYVCQAADGNWVLQGDVSWGSPRCSAAEQYSVFGRIAKFRNWIDQKMNS